IALVDEADVSLDQRATTNLEHNGLVSLFLRVLEYYEGILFLTTNRVGCFDKAFKSRIHLAIHYPELSINCRRRLWHLFLCKLSQEEAQMFDSDGTLDKLAQEDLNGRQIKNIVRTASALAFSDMKPLRADHIFGAVKSMKDFDATFDDLRSSSLRKYSLHDEIASTSCLKRRRIEVVD
ncbi:hypothetical protein GQ53DRAFT_631411, partial [Thozetella sp. PMI_491]